MSAVTASVTPKTRDPFNWPTYNRADLMSATGGLNGEKDLFPMKKANLVSKKR